MIALPVRGPFQITATYGQQGQYWANGHKGIDFVAADKTVRCTCNGVVRKVAYDPAGWGYYVSVGDAAGYRHIFCHLAQGTVAVKEGQQVTPETVIGTMGATGNVTGVHLHFQLQKGNTVVDPAPLLGIPNRKGSYHSQDFTEVSMAYRDWNSIPAWAKAAVDHVTEKGWMVGDENNDFRPNDPVTRAELAVVLKRLDETGE